jgi:hypothetical protein
MSRVAINRPGAIGDVVMISNCLPKLREQYDHIDFFCHSSVAEILKNFLVRDNLADGVGYSEKINFATTLGGRYDKIIAPTGYPLKEGYPDVKMRKHIVEFFADELGVEPSFDDLNLTPPSKPCGVNRERYITIQNKTGWSIYKEWWGWQKLIDRVKLEKPEIGIYQIGGPNDPPLVNIDGMYLGESFDDNLAVQCHSESHLGLDSVFNHTSNIRWQGIGKKSCVILFGSTQHDASGYPHNTNISLQLPCQPCFRENPNISTMSKGVCPNPSDQTYENPKHQCMANITVDMVYEAMVRILDRPRKSL